MRSPIREKYRLDLLANGCGRSRLHTLKQVLLEPPVLLVSAIRLCEWLGSRNSHKLCKLAWRLGVGRTGCYISPRAAIGGGISFPHPTGVVIGEGCTVGSKVVIYQGVTIGRGSRTGGYPTVGDDVTIYPNSVLIGGITIGQGAVIGAGSVVNRDVPAYAVVAGSPAQVIRQDLPPNG